MRHSIYTCQSYESNFICSNRQKMIASKEWHGTAICSCFMLFTIFVIFTLMIVSHAWHIKNEYVCVYQSVVVQSAEPRTAWRLKTCRLQMSSRNWHGNNMQLSFLSPPHPTTSNIVITLMFNSTRFSCLQYPPYYDGNWKWWTIPVFEIENRDFFQNRKKSKSRFYNKLVRRFLLTWNTFIFDRDNVATFW